MTRWLLWLLLSFAGAGEPRWAGVRLDALPGLGLGEAELTEDRSAWQAPLDGGGFVRFWWYADVEAAVRAWEGQAGRAGSVALPAVVLEGVDQAVGDGDGMLVLRSRNVVLVVRSGAEPASAVAGRLVRALAVDAPGLAPTPTGERDAYGRRGEDLGPPLPPELGGTDAAGGLSPR